MSFTPAEVKAEIAILRKSDPKLSFVKAWRKVQAVKPQLFDRRVEAEEVTLTAQEAAQREQQKSWGTFEVQCVSGFDIWTGEQCG